MNRLNLIDDLLKPVFQKCDIKLDNGAFVNVSQGDYDFGFASLEVTSTLYNNGDDLNEWLSKDITKDECLEIKNEVLSILDELIENIQE